jgi:hypothetical protein
MRSQPKRILGKWLPSHIEEMHRLAADAVARMTQEEALSTIRSGAEEFFDGVGDHFGSMSDGTRGAYLAHVAMRLDGEVAS